MACDWVVEDPLCCECWNTADPRMKEQAIAWATAVMNMRTGQQFGLCEITVRPCGWRMVNGLVEWFGASWSGSSWVPYLWNGQWYNAWCGCDGLCCCIPDCSVRLDGPVQSIIEVTLDGVVVDPSTYFVYDNTWLTRVEGNGCWPECSNLNLAPGEGWEVTYTRGRPVPVEVLAATAVLACEYVKGCKGDSSCRLSSRLVSMTRQGADFQFVSPDDMIKLGLTGINEVDAIITAYNPYGLKAPLRVFSPELRYPRVVTWP